MSLVPPEAMQAAARDGLDRYERGEGGDGLKPETIRRAKRIAAGEELTRDHVIEMAAWFARHAETRPEGEAEGTPWYCAWQLWGGDAGAAWSARRAEEIRENPERFRLALMSQVALAEGDAARPIHALRTGTFTDMFGRQSTFEPKHLRRMAEALNEQAQRRRPPINENHNMGRAVGRMLSAYTKGRDNDLFITPRWTAEGRQMIADEIYDGFSIELERDADGMYTIIGGALTNYPAVSGLAVVTLAAPPLDAPAVAHSTGDTHMADHEATAAGDQPTEPTPLTLPALPAIDDARVQAQMSAYAATLQQQMQQQHEAMLRQAEETARLQFERWRAEVQQQQAITAFVQDVTSATLERPYALPIAPERLSAFLLSVPTAARQEAQALLRAVLDGGLVSYEEIGSSADGEQARDVAAEWDAAVTTKVASGMSRSAAILAVKREKPALFSAYNDLGRGGR